MGSSPDEDEDAGPTPLGRRERQIMDVVHRLGEASVAEVRAALAEPPTYSAVRGMMGLLEQKGHLRHRRDGLRYVYAPTLAPAVARRHALRHMLATFFGGSVEEAATALFELSDTRLSDKDRARLQSIIRAAEKSGR
jgi:predicted transcriptional regulator